MKTDLATITISQLSSVTGGNSFANMSTKQVVDRLQECGYQAYMQGRKDQDKGVAPEFGRDRSIRACNFGIDTVNTKDKYLQD